MPPTVSLAEPAPPGSSTASATTGAGRTRPRDELEDRDHGDAPGGEPAELPSIAGFVTGGRVPPGVRHPAFFANGTVAWIEELAVREDVRRRGVGSRLVAEFEERRRDGRLVALATTRAGPFYEALGYSHHAAYYRKVSPP